MASPTPSSIFPRDMSTLTSPTPSSICPRDVSTLTSPTVTPTPSNTYPRDVSTLTSPTPSGTYPRDAYTLASPMAPHIYPNLSEMAMVSPTPRSRLPSMGLEECSDSESGTLSGSENGAFSDCSSEPREAIECKDAAARSRSSASQRLVGGWRGPLLHSRQLERSDQDSEEQPHQSQLQEQRWRIAGSRLASIFHSHSDSEGSDAGEKPQDKEHSPQQQEQRWRVAGQRLAAIFQAHSDSDDAPRAVRHGNPQ
mmetsp:Transcript_88335/g.169222  ORF Transcript_88335/g.169222 Transcript_88335/m.169222 type:complete len:253 (+) Transcript_88335:38-796(+)